MGDETWVHRDTAYSYVKRLCKAGIVRVLDEAPGKATVYRLMVDQGRAAPRIAADGSIVTQGQGNAQLWQAMRVLRRFTLGELIDGATTGFLGSQSPSRLPLRVRLASAPGEPAP